MRLVQEHHRLSSISVVPTIGWSHVIPQSEIAAIGKAQTTFNALGFRGL